MSLNQNNSDIYINKQFWILEQQKNSGHLVTEAVSTIKNTLESYGDFDGKSVLLFSGGRDSSIVASAFCKAFPQGELHLLYVNNGVFSDVDAPFKQYEVIKNLHPDIQITFETREVWQVMNRVAMQEIEKDFVEYGFSTLLVCVACKLIMAYIASIYAKETGIKFVLDGFASRQKHFPEQTETFITAKNEIFAVDGLRCISPLYDFLDDREKIITTLNGFGIGDKQEASCMFAHSFSEAKRGEIQKYIGKTIPLIERVLM